MKAIIKMMKAKANFIRMEEIFFKYQILIVQQYKGAAVIFLYNDGSVKVLLKINYSGFLTRGNIRDHKVNKM
jgi:hypothetical protein